MTSFAKKGLIILAIKRLFVTPNICNLYNRLKESLHRYVKIVYSILISKYLAYACISFSLKFLKISYKGDLIT